MLNFHCNNNDKKNNNKKKSMELTDKNNQYMLKL